MQKKKSAPTQIFLIPSIAVIMIVLFYGLDVVSKNYYDVLLDPANYPIITVVFGTLFFVAVLWLMKTFGKQGIGVLGLCIGTLATLLMAYGFVKAIVFNKPIFYFESNIYIASIELGVFIVGLIGMLISLNKSI